MRYGDFAIGSLTYRNVATILSNWTRPVETTLAGRGTGTSNQRMLHINFIRIHVKYRRNLKRRPEIPVPERLHRSPQTAGTTARGPDRGS